MAAGSGSDHGGTVVLAIQFILITVTAVLKLGVAVTVAII